VSKNPKNHEIIELTEQFLFQILSRIIFRAFTQTELAAQVPPARTITLNLQKGCLKD
jgi:hypothetical protein